MTLNCRLRTAEIDKTAAICGVEDRQIEPNSANNGGRSGGRFATQLVFWTRPAAVLLTTALGLALTVMAWRTAWLFAPALASLATSCWLADGGAS